MKIQNEEDPREEVVDMPPVDPEGIVYRRIGFIEWYHLVALIIAVTGLFLYWYLA